MSDGVNSRAGGGPAGVLFDMDGTLIDSEHQWLRAEIAVMARYDVTWTVQDQVHCLGGPLERVAMYMESKADPAAGCTRERVLVELLDEVDVLMRREPVAWRPGARELVLDALERAIPTGLVTASWRRLIDAVHDAMAIDLGGDPFTVMVGGDEVPRGKPHPDPYLAAAAALDLAPRDCLAVEDSPTGVRAAADAGCRVIAVPHIAPIDPDARVRVVPTLLGTTVPGLWDLHEAAVRSTD